MARSRLEVCIAVFPECDPSVVYGVFDVLWFAGRLWNPLRGAGAGEPIFVPRLVFAEPGPLTLVTGVQILSQDTIGDAVAPDLIVVPNVMVSTPDDVAALDRRLLAWIRRMHEKGVPIYAACGGSIVLAEAGLLDGRDATTHWGYVPLFRQCFPNVRLHEDRILVQSGPGHNVVCAGGASSWQDLCLMMIARHAGIEEALRVSKVFLLQWHREGQLPYAAMFRNTAHSDAVIARCQEWIGDNYPRRDIVTAALLRTKLKKRTFDRRFRAATGYSPLAYVQALRIEEAKQLLESGDLSIDSIGREVGYEDTASFRRLFRRLAGMLPGEYRRKFRIPRWAQSAAHLPQPSAGKPDKTPPRPRAGSLKPASKRPEARGSIRDGT